MTDIKARTISDYIATVPAPRLFTVETRAPCMSHQEILRHRRLITEEGLSVLGLGWEPDFSYSVSSTRAVPFPKTLEECRNPKLSAKPVHWGRARKGMVPGDEIDDIEQCVDWNEILVRLGEDYDPHTPEWVTRREAAKRIWDLHGATSALMAEVMVDVADPHKSIPNRMMAPHLHYNVLMTGTEPGWLNAMGLRLDKAADPLVRALFEQIWIQWNGSTPRVLKLGEWALPYADDDRSYEEAEGAFRSDRHFLDESRLSIRQKMSVARCAHLSYTSFETGERMTVVQCINLYERLVCGIPIHASPAEHQATPDTQHHWSNSILQQVPEGALRTWQHEHLAGNLGSGWIQLRKLLPNEAIAPIPEVYR